MYAKCKNRRHGSGRQETVEPVEQSAMPGDRAPGILHAQSALDRTLEQIAGLRKNTQQTAREQRESVRPLQAAAPRAPADPADDQPTDRAAPGLARRDARRQL